jgi:hypothetical protein
MTENKEALNVVDLSIEIEELESKIAPDDCDSGILPL